MRRNRLTALCTIALLWIFALPAARAAESGMSVLVGLAYGSGALDGANLANDAGRGFRLGYLAEDRIFQQLGYTEETSVSVVKTQNVWYGLDSSYSDKLKSYSDSITSDILVGCWHVQLPVEPQSFEEAVIAAAGFDGFPAWIGGAWQVRAGAYGTREEAQAAAEALGGTVAGTSAYGVSVVKTGTSHVLFQFDGGEALSLTVVPDLDATAKAVTHFRGSRYFGAFQFRRVNGGDLTISNLVEQNDYINCVISEEMSRSWPLEALKAQAICARNYYETKLNRHKANGFDICSTTHCQAYYGMGNTDERTAQASAETAGLRAWYDGKLAELYYFSSDGGGTENVRNVWDDGDPIPYLCGVIDPYEATISDKIAYWDETTTFTASQLTSILQANKRNCSTIVDFQVTEYTPTGNVKSIAFTDSNGAVWPFFKESGIRNMLGLRSMRYTVTKSGGSAGGTYYVEGGGTLSSMGGVYAISGKGTVGKLSHSNPYVITGTGTQYLPAPSGGSVSAGEAVFTVHSSGWGHHVGMSQWGAYAMASQGMSFTDILTFYFPGIEIY